MKQLGLSPKVAVPAAGQVLVGVVLLLLGLDVEGQTALATGLGTFVVGFGAKPGTVTAVDDTDRGEGY